MTLQDADLGAVLTVKEFEELVIARGIVEDLMDRTDLARGEFLDRCISRVNATRCGHHAWVTNADRTRVILTHTPLAAAVRNLFIHADQLDQTAARLREMGESLIA